MAIPRIKLPLPVRLGIVKKITCKDVSVLISRQHEQPLSTSEKLWLRLHLYICTGCRNFQNNSRLMRAAMKRFLDQGKDR
jgi:hypothetical protein